MEEKILQDFKDYFGNDYNEEQESTLLFCIRRAIQSFKNKKNYPESYKEENIEKDMERYQMCIFDLALYWCVMQGYEFQNSHSESGVSRSWKSEEDIYALHNVIPIAKIV